MKNLFIVFACLTLPLWVFTQVNVMAPLHVKVYNDTLEEEKDWEDLTKYLQYAHSLGVKAITVDVWWGAVQEKGKDKFDWSYYNKLFDYIKSNNLDIIPIMSFHQCGGNVGDNYTKLLPPWIWNQLAEDSGIEKDQLKYRSNNAVCNEYVSLWADEYVMKYYSAFIKEFLKEFNDYHKIIPEINVSCGPSGELRYPAYNSHDNWKYPDKGRFQCYSSIAKESFKKAMLQKYGSLKNLNKHWNMKLSSEDKILPPDNPDFFFSNGDYKNMQYGRDFTEWYNNCLIEHGHRMLLMAYDIIKNTAFSESEIGFKIPGIHWQIVNPDYPRAAEITAGLINSKFTSCDYNHSDTAGYGRLISEVVPDEMKSKVTLHFTCLEMCNRYNCDGSQINDCLNGDYTKDYSMASALVFWVGNVAKENSIELKGENALAIGPCDASKWNNINNVFDHSNYKGITILRLKNICNPDDKCSPNYFKEFIPKINQ